MRSLLLAIGILAPGCDQVFSLDRPDQGTDVTVRRVVRSVRNNQQFAPEILDDVRITGQTPVVTLDDGSEAAVTIDGDQFTFPRSAKDQAYRVKLVTSAGALVEYQFTTPALDLFERQVGRPDRMIGVGAALEIMLPASPVPAGGSPVFISTGVWTDTMIFGPDTDYTFDWATATSLSGPVGLIEASRNDHAYAAYARPRTTTTGTYNVLTDLCEPSPQPELVLGQLFVTGCAYAPLTLDRCTKVSTDRIAEEQRLQQVLVDSAAYTETEYSWVLSAVPAPELGSEPGIPLANQTATASPRPVTSWTGDVQYANPFPGHATRLGMTVTKSRQIRASGSTAISVVASSKHWVTPAADCSTPTEVVSRIGIPGAFALAGQPLDENAMISLDRSSDVVLSWSLPANGAVDFYVVRIQKVFPSLFGGTMLGDPLQYVTTSREVAIDPLMLVAGTRYIVSIEANLGFPKAAMGDLRTIDPEAPSAVANTYSGVFMIGD